MTLKLYTSVAKVLKLKVRMFRGLVPTFVEVAREKQGEGPFCILPILNRVNYQKCSTFKYSHFSIFKYKKMCYFQIPKTFYSEIRKTTTFKHEVTTTFKYR